MHEQRHELQRPRGGLGGTMSRRDFLAALASAAGLVGVGALVARRVSPSMAVGTEERAPVGPGQIAPPLATQLLEGGSWTHDVARPTWINVWATWCPPCRTEMPEIDAIVRARGGELDFLALNFREDAPVIRQYLANTRYGFAVALDPDAALADALGVATLPAHIFIAPGGVIEAIRVGGMTSAEMVAHVEAISAR